MEGLKYEYWENSCLHGYQWGVSELWWHDKAKVLYKNVNLVVDCPSAQSFKVYGNLKDECETGEYIVRFWWDGNIEKDFAYSLQMRMTSEDHIPHIIIINNKIVWSKPNDTNCVLENNSLKVNFFADKTEELVVELVVKLDNKRRDYLLLPPHQGDYRQANMVLLRSKYDKKIEYPKYIYPKNSNEVFCNKNKSARMFHGAYDYICDRHIDPIPSLSYKKNNDIIFLEHDLNPSGNNSYILKDLEVNGIVYIPTNDLEISNFEKFAKDTVKRGVKHLMLMPVIRKSILSKELSNEEFAYCYLSDFILGSNSFMRIPKGTFDSEQFFDDGIKSTADCAKKWLEFCPEGKVYIFYPEVNGALGSYSGGISSSIIKHVKGYENVSKGGRESYKEIFRFFKNLRNKINEQLQGIENVEVWCHPDFSGYNQAVTQNLSVDLCMGKNIHRENGNIALANARGNAFSYSKKYGMVMDTWDRVYWWNWTYEGIKAGLLSYYIGGCKIYANEIYTESRKEHYVTKWGQAWFDFIRFAKVHPSIGEPIVKFGIIRGLGCEWQRLAGDSSSWEADENVYSLEMQSQLNEFWSNSKWLKAFNKQKKGEKIEYLDTYFADFDLLNIFAFNYGRAHKTDNEKAFTGTPFGPFNFVAYDTPSYILSNYDLLIYCGRGIGTTKDEICSMEEYVSNGGHLILSVGQLKNDQGELEISSFAGVEFEEEMSFDGLVYTKMNSENIVEKISFLNGDIHIITGKFGAGKVTISAGEYLTDYNIDSIRKLINNYATSYTALKFSEKPNHIDFSINKKNDILIIPFINQGRGFYPSGNGVDHGVFRSNLKINIEEFHLSPNNFIVYKAVVDTEGNVPVNLEEYKFTLHNNIVEVDIEINYYEELVFGDKSVIYDTYFS